MVDEPDSAAAKSDPEQRLQIRIEGRLVIEQSPKTQNREHKGADPEQHSDQEAHIAWYRRLGRWILRVRDDPNACITAFSTFGILAFTVVLACVSIYQGRLIERQLNDSQAVQAASILIEDFKVEDFQTSPAHPRVSYVLKNIGQTRPDSVLPGLTYVTYDPARGPYVEHMQIGVSPRDENNGFPLAQGGTDPISQTIDLTTIFQPTKWPYPPQVQAHMPKLVDVIDGKVGLAISVHVPYYDVFHSFYEVRKCLFYNAHSQRFEPCILGNPYPEK